MYDCLITFRSVMPAQRAEETLRNSHVDCQVRRTPKWMESQGCGYSLRLEYARLPQALQLLQQNRISYRKIYRRSDGGRLELVHL